MDLSENLTILTEHLSQSLYWSLVHLSVISGILKSKDGKSYHPYISDSKTHDQSFTKIVKIADVSCADNIAIDSDNCSAQYKSGLHIYHRRSQTNTVLHLFACMGFLDMVRVKWIILGEQPR